MAARPLTFSIIRIASSGLTGASSTTKSLYSSASVPPAPIVLVGAGGTLAELYKDFVVELAPVSPDEAMRMIEKVKGLAAIRGYRNLPRGDVKALARAVSAISRLALIPGRPLLEAEINPLLVRREGVVAVDGLAVLKE